MKRRDFLKSVIGAAFVAAAGMPKQLDRLRKFRIMHRVSFGQGAERVIDQGGRP